MYLALILISFFAAALICLFSKHKRLIESASAIAALIAIPGAAAIAGRVAKYGSYAPASFFFVDALGAILVLIISLIGLAVSMYSVSYLRREAEKGIIGFKRVRQYFVLLNLFLATMTVAATASHPIFTWIAIEATTLSTAFLISFYNKPAAMEAAWKYLVISSLGLLLGFFGTLLYMTAAGESAGTFVTWQSLLSGAAGINPAIAKIAFVFALIGYGTKAGLAPMHTWLPDAHSKAPAPISGLLSGVLLNIAFVAVLRSKRITDAAIGADFSSHLFIVFGFISILIAALIILTQKNYKRLLAYSSIENMGLMTLGFGFGGLGVFAAMLHMIYHALIKSALFLSAGTILLTYSSTKIDRVRGLLAVIPATAVIFLVGLFAVTGAPPFGIFYTKMMILSAGSATWPIVTLFVVGLLAILFIGFFKQVAAMAFGEKPDNFSPGQKNNWLVVPPLALLAVALFLSIHLPRFLQTLLSASAM